MELNKNILDGICVVGNSTEISDASFDLLLRETFEVATSNQVLKGYPKEVVGCLEKTAQSCLLSLLLEAAKNDIDQATLSSVLEEGKWEANRVSLFVTQFQEHKDKIQSLLSMIGKSYDHIIDVDWRQDFVIKSSNCEKICEPSYVVSLKTWNPRTNTADDVSFSCTMEQLQDLVLKLKDATKCIERNSV